MDGLQDALQSILSDPAQMEQIAAMARSLGVNPPGAAPAAPAPVPSGTETGVKADPPGLGMDLAGLMQRLGSLQGAEDKVFAALRPSASPQGRQRMDRAVRAAKLARLLGQFLQGKGGSGHV